MAFLTLLRIELMRSRVWLLVVVMTAAFAVTNIRFLLWDYRGGVTWFWIGGTAEQLAGAFPFGVAFATWYAGRSHRNHLNEVNTSKRWLRFGGHGPALVSIIGVLAVIVVVVFAVVTLRIRQSSIEHTGSAPNGPYPWLQIVVIFTAFAAFIVWGYWLGYRLKSPLTPLVSAFVMNMILQLSRRMSTVSESLDSLGAIVPTRISYELAPYIGDRVYLQLALWGIAWFIVLGTIPLLMLRKTDIRRPRGRILTTAVAVLALVCVFNVTSAMRSAGQWHGNHRTLACVERAGTNFCAPPGAMSDADLEAVAHYYDQLLPTWMPPAHLPERLSVPITGDQLPSNAVSMVSFQYPVERNSYGYMRAVLYLIAGPGVLTLEPTAAHLVVACAMLQDSGNSCGIPHPVDSSRSMPVANDSLEGKKLVEPIIQLGRQPTEKEVEQLESDLTELQTQMQQKLDSFTSLSDAEKFAWLDANWDQLSSGELTLDEMP